MNYHIEQSGTRRSFKVRAVCDCGWKSPWLPSGGLAGAVWDRHKQKEHQ